MYETDWPSNLYRTSRPIIRDNQSILTEQLQKSIATGAPDPVTLSNPVIYLQNLVPGPPSPNGPFKGRIFLHQLPNQYFQLIASALFRLKQALQFCNTSVP